MEKIIIGKIGTAVGLKGEVKINNYSETDGRYENLEILYVDGKPCKIEKVRYQGAQPILKIEGIDNRNAAELLRGKNISMDESELEEPEDGSYYIRDLIGLEVFNTETQEKIGNVKDVLTDRPQEILVIKVAAGKEVMVPFVEAFVPEVDIEAGKLELNVIEGLIEE